MVQIPAFLKSLPTVLALVEVAKEAYEWLTSDEPEEEQPAKKLSRKKPDTTRLTQYQYDFIVYARSDWEHYNKTHSTKDRKYLSELVDVINERMGTDKSTRALSRVWSGELDRDSLPKGKPYFEY